MKSKKILILLSLILFISLGMNMEFAHASNDSNKTVTSKVVNSTKYVEVEGSLIMRDAANSKGKKVTMLKDGSKVFVYSTDSNGWSHVKQGNFKGYTLDKYLIVKKENKSNSNSNSTKKSTVNYDLKLQELDNAIYEIQVKQLEYPTHSQAYRNLLEKQLKLEKEKLSLIQQKKKELLEIINGK